MTQLRIPWNRSLTRNFAESRSVAQCVERLMDGAHQGPQQ
jgi:hypothetical protein